MIRFVSVTSAILFCFPVHAVGDSAQAESIFSQTIPAEPASAFGSQDKPTGQKIADNLAVVGDDPIVLRSIRFLGGYGLVSPPPLTPPLDALPEDNFRVVVLDDMNGTPGSPVPGGDFAVGSAVRRQATGGPMLNGLFSPFEYLVDLGDGIELANMGEYWISITNDPGPDYGWLWARAEGVIDGKTAATFDDVHSGLWNIFSNGGMFFELNDHNVPEPASLVILSTAVVFAMYMSRMLNRLSRS